MPLNKIPIRSQGGPVTVEIVFGHAQVGAYNLVMWNASGSGRQHLGEGVNTDQTPDVYTLPQPNTGNIGRLLDCVATVIAPNLSPGSRYRVDMVVRQDGGECGREYDEGPILGKSVSTRLAVEIAEKGEGA